jgi:phage gp16-like protein
MLVCKIKPIAILQSIFFRHNGIKIEISNSKISRKSQVFRVNKVWVKGVITRKIRTSFEQNDKENKTYKNLWATVKTGFQGKFIILHTY